MSDQETKQAEGGVSTDSHRSSCSKIHTLIERRAIDWKDLFKQAGVPPQKARLVCLKAWGWVLDIGDPFTILCVEPPEVEGCNRVMIENNEWAFYS